MLAKLVGAPVLSTGIVVVTIFRPEAAARNGSEKTACGRVTRIGGTGVCVVARDALRLTFIGGAPLVGANILVIAV